ncbi:MAG: hypothetical protein Q8N18_09305 [Opitutaceae bacterium]|nr:hypothetical protein [Opitutaceae bacterium]
MNPYQEALRMRLAKMPITAPKEPWTSLPQIAIGGLREAGFLPGSDTLLVISSSGRGLFDALTGKRIGRDEEGSEKCLDEIRLTAVSIVPKEGIKVRVAGLAGGGLPLSTNDGWRVQEAAPDWPRMAVYLQPPGCSVFVEQRASGAQKIFEDCELRVCGFSETGRSLIVGTSDTLYIFTR